MIEDEMKHLLDYHCGRTMADDTVHYSRAAVLKAMVAAHKRGLDDMRYGKFVQKHKFGNVSCSNCGKSFGPGDNGFSYCENHAGLTVTSQ